MRVGFAGSSSGAVVQNGGDVTVTTYWLGYLANSGTHTLNNGTLTVNSNFYISEGTAISGVTQTGGTATVANLLVGSNQAGANGFYDLQGGDLNVTGLFRISNQNGSNVDGVFTQSGGTADSNVTLQFGSKAGTTGSAIYNLDGGTLTVNHATPFQFTNVAAPVYFDFDGGTLNLLGTWDYTNLTAIANSDFRFQGAPLQDGDLVFTAGTGPLTGYTVVAIPEPSTFALSALGLLGLLACGRRRRG
jgi:hypothetical protein